METLILICGIITTGYLLKKDKENLDNQEYEYIQKPNGKNIYSSNIINETNQYVLNKALDLNEKSLNPSINGIIPNFFTFPKSGFTYDNNLNFIPNSKQMSIIEDYNKINSMYPTDAAQQDITNMPMFKSSLPNSQIDFNTKADLQESNNSDFGNTIQDEISLLTGMKLEKIHNNMVPFFGSKVKQNMDQFANVSLLDLYTGNKDTFFHKQEVGPFFQNVKQDINGTPSITENLSLDRFIPSNFRQNEKPFQDIKVSANIMGSIDDPRNNPLAKDRSINELRPGNRPRISYNLYSHEGAAKVTALMGEIGQVQKKNVPSSYEYTQDHYLKGQSIFNETYFPPNYSAQKLTSRQSDYYSGNPSLQNFGSYQSYQLNNEI